MPVFSDMRVTKDFVAVLCSLAIGLSVLYKHGFKPFKEKWILFFLLFLVWNLFKIPSAYIPFGSVNINGMWNFWSAYQIMAYFILLLGIINFPECHRRRMLYLLFNVSIWTGVVLSVYMLLQWYGLDQIFITYPAYLDGVTISGSTKNPSVGGTIGQPTLAAPFLIMVLPFCLYLRKNILAGILLLGILATGSTVSFFACAVVMWAYWLWKIKSENNHYAPINAQAYVVVSIILMVVVWIAMSLKGGELLNDNGRFLTWQAVIKDFSPRNILTGFGIGAFKFAFAVKHKNTWFHAHNEYLQLLWSCGIVGFFIVGMMLKNIYSSVIRHLNSEVVVLAISFLSLLICGLGTFVFQMAVYQFYGVVILGMIHVLTREVRNG